MKTIPLTQGQVALVDDEDYEFLIGFRWFAYFNSYNWYAVKKNSKRMHRLIMERIKPGFKGEIDHIDGNGLNNQRSNLRIATHSQNLANKGPQENNTSGYKGVSWDKEKQKWRAQIQYRGVISFLGYFDSEIKAAITYDYAALRLFGEFARTNFPRENYAHIKPISDYVGSSSAARGDCS